MILGIVARALIGIFIASVVIVFFIRSAWCMAIRWLLSRPVFDFDENLD
jgi:hypothetical protein